MRIMATSDLHGNLDGLDPTGADVVVLAGDVAPLRGRGPWHINDQKKWINKRFREWTASYPDIQFVVIPGNHDFYPIAHILTTSTGRSDSRPTSISSGTARPKSTAFASTARHGCRSSPIRGRSRASPTGSLNGSPRFLPDSTCLSRTRRRTSPEATWIDHSKPIPNTSARQN